jgi:hypothetical protein
VTVELRSYPLERAGLAAKQLRQPFCYLRRDLAIAQPPATERRGAVPQLLRELLDRGRCGPKGALDEVSEAWHGVT